MNYKNVKYQVYVQLYHLLRKPFEKLAYAISQMEHPSYKLTDFETVHRYGLGERIKK